MPRRLRDRATGEAHSVREFSQEDRARVGLDPQGLDDIDAYDFRPTEVDHLLGDASKARKQLGWAPRVGFKDLVRMMVDHDQELARREKTLRDAGHRIAARGEGGA